MRTQAERLEAALRKLGFQARITGSTAKSMDIEEAVDAIEYAAVERKPRGG